MIKVEIGKDPIDKALKIFKRKFDRVGVIKELKKRKEFKKKSVVRREEIKKAIYVEKTFYSQND
ncbi:MAG: 30S ribosomal protein S21 [Flavobacteriaceae bacterium]|jgi:small subunit ribosomal protein S21|nr:30S ribosomal protein S21 [Flavobacteriaceae bacterium]